jgi:hypothetical protein
VVPAVDEKAVRTALDKLGTLVRRLGREDLAALKGPLAPAAERAAYHWAFIFDPDEVDKKPGDLSPVIVQCAFEPIFPPLDTSDPGVLKDTVDEWVVQCGQSLG